MERNCLSNFGRGLSIEHCCEIILKSVHWFRRRSCLKLIFYLKPWRPFCSMETNGLSNFGRGSPKEHASVIISKSIYWIRRRGRLNVFLFLALAAILFNRVERFVQFS